MTDFQNIKKHFINKKIEKAQRNEQNLIAKRKKVILDYVSGKHSAKILLQAEIITSVAFTVAGFEIAHVIDPNSYSLAAVGLIFGNMFGTATNWCVLEEIAERNEKFNNWCDNKHARKIEKIDNKLDKIKLKQQEL